MTDSKFLQNIVENFAIDGEFEGIEPIKRGHINETFASSWRSKSGRTRFVHQRINHLVFKDVEVLMSTVERVTKHLAKSYAKNVDGERRCSLILVPTRDGKSYLQTEAPQYWRTYHYIEDTESFDVCPSAHYAFEAARILADFVTTLKELPVDQYKETIPRFQDSRYRYEAFDLALEQNRAQRINDIGAEIEFALSERLAACAVIDALNEGRVPLRLTHADPKVNNVLFDPRSKRGVGVVDLDTVMPGSVLYDFGDLVRSTAVPAAEDETNLAKVYMSMEYYAALIQGYLAAAGNFLTKEERALLPVAPRALALTLGVRFLTDHLNGDVYFRVSRPGQNLDRARTQFQIARSMASQESQMRALSA